MGITLGDVINSHCRAKSQINSILNSEKLGSVTIANKHNGKEIIFLLSLTSGAAGEDEDLPRIQKMLDLMR